MSISSNAASGWDGWANLDFLFTFLLVLFQPWGADYAHHIIACQPGFENLTASLISGCYQIGSQQFMLKKNDTHTI